MRARDLRSRINWNADGDARFCDILEYFTSEWIMEAKLDGCRVRLRLGELSNRVTSARRSKRTSNYTDRSDNFPHLRDAVVPALSDTVIEGELLAPGPMLQTHTGTWTDSLLNASVALTNSNPLGAALTQERFGKAQFHAFDVLAFKNIPVLDLPLRQRRDLLVYITATISSHHPESQVSPVPRLPSCAASIDHFVARGYEGVVIKHEESTYEIGKRSKRWLKAKPFSSADAFICGYSPGLHGNAGKVGSLDVAVRRKDGSDRPVAQLGNLSASFRQEISAGDGSLRQEFYGLVVEFSAQGLTKSGRARHGSMIRVRPDKSPDECTEDQLHGFPKV